MKEKEMELALDRETMDATTSSACARTIPLHVSGRYRANCSACSLREICLPQGMADSDIKVMDQLVYTQRRLRRGEPLFQAGDPFRSLYALRSGFLKSLVIAEDGREQVIGFQMAGDIVGLDGIDSDHHSLTLVALEYSEVCVVPYQDLERLVGTVPNLQHRFHRMMSREIVREQGVMTLLGTMGAEQRVAAFLLNLSRRFTMRGFSPREFNLRMTREEIGSYLGLTLETVSRTFSRLQERGIISIKQRWVRIEDPVRIEEVLRNNSTAGSLRPSKAA